MNRRALLKLLAILPFLGLEGVLKWLARRRDWPTAAKEAAANAASLLGRREPAESFYVDFLYSYDFSHGERGKYLGQSHVWDVPPAMRVTEIDRIRRRITMEAL